MIEAIITWWKSKNINSRVVFGVLLAAATAVSTDEQLRSTLVKVLVDHPKLATDIIAIAGIIFKLSHSTGGQSAG